MRPSLSSLSLELALVLVVVLPCPEAMVPYILLLLEAFSRDAAPSLSYPYTMSLSPSLSSLWSLFDPSSFLRPLPTYESCQSCHPNVRRRCFLLPCIEVCIDLYISSPEPLFLPNIVRSRGRGSLMVYTLLGRNITVFGSPQVFYERVS